MRIFELEQPLANEEMVVVVRPNRIERYEATLARNHARVVKKACALRHDNRDDGHSDGELYGNQLLVAERQVAVRLGGAI